MLGRAFLASVLALAAFAACSSFDTVAATEPASDASVETSDLANDAAVDAGALEPYEVAVRATGPVAYWRLDEVAGPLAKDAVSPNADASRYHGDVRFEQAGAIIGSRSTAVRFGGSTLDPQYIAVVGTVIPSTTTSFTLEAWISTETRTGTVVGNTAPRSGIGYRLVFNADGKLALEFSSPDGGISRGLSSSGAMPTGWHHVAGVVDLASHRWSLWLDGSPFGTANVDATEHANVVQFAIGAAGGGAESFFDGLIDEVAVYDRALTGDELANHYAVGAGKTLP